MVTWSSNSLITLGPETFDSAGVFFISHGHSVTRGLGFQGLGDQNDDSGIN